MRDPYCFVLMPFGKRPDATGEGIIDFDHIYLKALVPAIRAAGLHPHRDDSSAVGGIVQKQIYEALLLCDFAVADLTVENANVYYELGVRHAVRPASTLAVSANVDSIPFDVAYLRTLRYRLGEHNILEDQLADDLQEAVTTELRELRRNSHGRTDFADSPLFQLIEGWRPIRPESLKTDLFAERVAYNDAIKQRLELARIRGLRGPSERANALGDVAAIRNELGELDKVEAGILVDLLLTYRSFELWAEMCDLIELMPGFVRDRTLVQEQLAFALNRRAVGGLDEHHRDRALQVLSSLIDQGRGSSETWGLMGRIHKDRWRQSQNPYERQRHLKAAIEAYRRGFRRDLTDPYPGINAATLLRISGTPDDLRELLELLPVVRYAADRLIEIETPTYWMYATQLEVAILGNDRASVLHYLDEAIRAVRETWEPRTTLRNIADLTEAGAMSGEDWMHAVTAQLQTVADLLVGE